MSTGSLWKIENYSLCLGRDRRPLNMAIGVELQKQKEVIETITVVAAQHRQMDQVLKPLTSYLITIWILWGKARPYWTFN